MDIFTSFCLHMVVELGQAKVLMKLTTPGIGSLVNLDLEPSAPPSVPVECSVGTQRL